ncbi:uncharacterized protein LOC143896491 [Temnothorax americanus]|uniref:uncharacterized protein LOC143896491 n=1 Tax=Temnothorax americanus TaxID=1964332 RepID=UPI0040692AAE
MKRWKEKLQTVKQYNRRLKQVENGKRRRKEEETEETEETECVVDGRRIIDLKVMSQHMIYTFCNEDLWMRNIKQEKKYGLASVFSVLCQNCLLMNKVPSGYMHPGPNKLQYDVNTKSALGTVHSGLGYTSVNKYLQCLNIPNMSPSSYKRYEREIGPIIEVVAKQSCQEATKLEQFLTIQNVESLERLL